MDKDRDSIEWQTGMKEFLDFAFEGAPENSTVPCPCRRCNNICWKRRKDIHIDLLKNGMDPSYTHWTFHGEGSREEAISEDSDEEVTRDAVGVHDMLSSLIRGTNVDSDRSNEDKME
jgi:hypothetical protein